MDDMFIRILQRTLAFMIVWWTWRKVVSPWFDTPSKDTEE